MRTYTVERRDNWDGSWEVVSRHWLRFAATRSIARSVDPRYAASGWRMLLNGEVIMEVEVTKPWRQALNDMTDNQASSEEIWRSTYQL